MDIHENWKKFLIEQEEKKVLLKDLMDGINKYKDSVWVFFDTETTGLKPEDAQLLEIAAVAVKSDLMDETGFISKFHTKVTLTPETEKKRSEPHNPTNPRDKSIDDLLKMTQYHNTTSGAAYIEEKKALEDFFSFLDGLAEKGDIVLVAHNAKFDNNFISVRSKKYSISQTPRDVIDTLQVMEEVFYPLILVVDELGILPKIKTKFGVSFTLGNVSNALDINVDDWHSALADVKMLIKVTKSVLKYLEKNGEIDVTTGYKKAMDRKVKMDKFRNR